MWQLYYFPLCPFSRKVRLALSEKGVGYELRRENPWDGSDEFYAYNPAGRTPVLRLEEKNLTLIDSQAICEFFEETVDKSPLILGTAAGRAEIRRLTALFDESFFADVTQPLLHEKMKKRLVLQAAAGFDRAAQGDAAGARAPRLHRLADRHPPLAGRARSSASPISPPRRRSRSPTTSAGSTGPATRRRTAGTG